MPGAHRGRRDQRLHHRHGRAGARGGVASRGRDLGRHLPGAAARRASGLEGSDLHRGNAHHDGIGLLRGPRPRPRRHGRAPAARRRRRHSGQDEHPRVRLRSDGRPLALRTYEEPPRSRQDHRRLQRRLGGGRRGEPRLRRSGIGHRRLDPHPRRPLRRRRHETDLRSREQARRVPPGLDPGPRRPTLPHRRGQRPPAERAGRPRPPGSLLREPTPGGLRPRAARRPPEHRRRHPQGLLLRARRRRRREAGDGGRRGVPRPRRRGARGRRCRTCGRRCATSA